MKWIEHYLCGREQKVVIEGYSSQPTIVQAGVPQGSVLGPFFFLLYVNDVADIVTNAVRLFADDTSLFVIVYTTEEVHVHYH